MKKSFDSLSSSLPAVDVDCLFQLNGCEIYGNSKLIRTRLISQEVTVVDDGVVVADPEEQHQRVANMARSVGTRREGGEGGKPKKDRRTTMLGRFRRPRPPDGGEPAGETNAALANFITGKKEKKVRVKGGQWKCL